MRDVCDASLIVVAFHTKTVLDTHTLPSQAVAMQEAAMLMVKISIGLPDPPIPNIELADKLQKVVTD